MKGRREGPPSLIETIPFRTDLESIFLKDAKIVTVYSREEKGNYDE